MLDRMSSYAKTYESLLRSYMKNPETVQLTNHRVPTRARFYEISIGFVVLALLILAFGKYAPMSGDLTQHYMLVDELTKHGGVRIGLGSIGLMAVYPPGSHWFASLAGRIFGTGLEGIIVISIVSLFACYWLIIKLVGNSIGAATIVAVLFALLAGTDSLVGWEVWVNFFYPQLVGDVLYFGFLLWLGTKPRSLHIVIAAAIAGYISMWIQPLNALHLLGASLTFLALQPIMLRLQGSKITLRSLTPVVALGVATIALLLLHPSLRAMMTISKNDGYLEFSYKHPSMIAIACAAIGLINLLFHIKRKTAQIDYVLACAAIASMALVLAQSLALHFLHLGSPYAIKKHMFIVFTVGMLNTGRILVSTLRIKESDGYGWLYAPLLAGIFSASILRCYTTPIVPIVDAINYAESVAFKYPPGEVVVDLARQPRMIDVLITQSSFQHPYDASTQSWLTGGDLTTGSKLLMVETRQLNSECLNRVSPADRFAIVELNCINKSSVAENK